MVKTRIVCTLGPASENVATLRKMMLAGMDVARLNCSHGTHELHRQRMSLVRELDRRYRRHVRILLDLEGYRIRIGKFRSGRPVELKKKQVIRLTNKQDEGGKDAIPFDYPGPLSDLKTGGFIYIDDGNIALRIKAIARNYLRAEVVIPGILKENKGVNIPDARLRFKTLTEKDQADLEFGIRHKVDFIAQSFVRNRRDIVNIRDFIRKRGFDCGLIAKIENRQGIRNIAGILDAADGIMVARGDLGVSLPIYEVPMLQKMLIRKCRQEKKFVITATQMLESMTEHVRPTRAEVSDVANAILDGSDYVMLSAETAVGLHPVEAVQMMNRIIAFTERSLVTVHPR